MAIHKSWIFIIFFAKNWKQKKVFYVVAFDPIKMGTSK